MRVRDAGRRKVWLLGIGGLGTLAGFVALLVVGTYVVAANMGVGGRVVGLAKGAVPAAYEQLVQKWGSLCPALNPALLAAQLYQESGWRPDAKSTAQAQGIAQFIPGTWAAHGVDGDKDGDRDVWDPKDAIPSAANYDCKLASYVKDAPGSQTDNMLAAYNAGAYAVIKYAGVPPYRETKNYVATIRKMEQSFASTKGRVDPSKQAAGAIYYAQKKLGTPYLWGGKTSLGLDCSGLVQVALTACGVPCPRDSDMQERALGAPVDRPQLRRGDFVFWKGHVAIARDAETLVHANGFHMTVVVEPAAEAIDRIGRAGSHVTSMRRLTAN